MCTVAGCHVAAREAILRQWPHDRSREMVVSREVALLLLEDPDCRLRMQHVEEIVRGRLPDLVKAPLELECMLKDAVTARFLQLESVGEDKCKSKLKDVEPFTMLRLNVEEMVKYGAGFDRAATAAVNVQAEELNKQVGTPVGATVGSDAEVVQAGHGGRGGDLNQSMEEEVLGKEEGMSDAAAGGIIMQNPPEQAVLPACAVMPLMSSPAGAPVVFNTIPKSALSNLPSFPSFLFETGENHSEPSSTTNISELDFPFGDEDLFKNPHKDGSSTQGLPKVSAATEVTSVLCKCVDSQSAYSCLVDFNLPSHQASAPIQCQPRQPADDSLKDPEEFSPHLDTVVPPPRQNASCGSIEAGGVVRPPPAVAQPTCNLAPGSLKSLYRDSGGGHMLEPNSLLHQALRSDTYLSSEPPRFGSVPGLEGSLWMNQPKGQSAPSAESAAAVLGKPSMEDSKSNRGSSPDASRPSRKSTGTGTPSSRSVASGSVEPDVLGEFKIDIALGAILAFSAEADRTKRASSLMMPGVDCAGFLSAPGQASAATAAKVPPMRFNDRSSGGGEGDAGSQSLPLNDWSHAAFQEAIASMSSARKAPEDLNGLGSMGAVPCWPPAAFNAMQGSNLPASLTQLLQQQQQTAGLQAGQGALSQAAKAHQILTQQMMAGSSTNPMQSNDFDFGPTTAKVAAASFMAAMASLAAAQGNVQRNGVIPQMPQLLPSSWPPPPQGFLPSVPANVGILSQFSPLIINEIASLVCQVPGLKIEDFDDGVLHQLSAKRSEEEAVAALRSFVGSNLASMQHKSACLRHGIKNFWLNSVKGDLGGMQGCSGGGSRSCTGLSASAQTALQKLPPRVYQRLSDLISRSPFIDWKHFDAGVIKVISQLSEIGEADMLEELEMLDSADLSNVEYMPAYLNKRMNNRLWNRRKALNGGSN